MTKFALFAAAAALGLAACGNADDVDTTASGTAATDTADVRTATDRAATDARADARSAGQSLGSGTDDMMDDMDDDMDDTMMSDSMSDGVVVTVNGVQGTGTVYVALQSEDIFGSADATYGASAPASDATGGRLEVTITDVEEGDYAVAAFQDANGNGQMDVGGNGVPTEPWALSNGAGTRGAPTFGAARMSFDGSGTASVTLNN